MVRKGAKFIHQDEEDRRLAAYSSHFTDRAAADSLGMNKLTFTAWRSRRGLANRQFDAPQPMACLRGHRRTAESWGPSGCKICERERRRKVRAARKSFQAKRQKDIPCGHCGAPSLLKGMCQRHYDDARRAAHRRQWLTHRRIDPVRIAEAVSIAMQDGPSEASCRTGFNRWGISKWVMAYGDGEGRRKLVLAAHHRRRRAAQVAEVEDGFDEVEALLKRMAAERAFEERRAALRSGTTS
jgi:hypothetical protein